MNKNKLAEFIKAFKKNVLKNKKKQSVGSKLQRWFTLSLVGAATVLPAKEANTMPVDKNFFPTNVTTKLPMRFDNKEDMATLETLRKETINHVVEIQSAKLQERIIHNIDSLQQEVLAAKRRGGRRQMVRSMFYKVYPKGGFSGMENYCVAGAMLAQIECRDNILNNILPDPSKKAEEYEFGGHPNVSCPSMRRFFKKTLGNNYSDRRDKNFREFIKTLEPGDIITVRSRTNTGSGEHCVTCVGSVKNGKIRVSGFNNERTYEVSISQIVGAAKIMKQYREQLEKQLESDMRLMPIMAQGKVSFSFDSIKPMPKSIPLVHNIPTNPLIPNMLKTWNRVD